jgi:hypothetical protein
MKESVAIAKEADAKKGVSPTKSDKSVHRVRNEPERQLSSLRGVIGNIRRDGGTPSVENIATELSGMSTGGRAPALLALQRTHGNRYVQRVVSGIQAKLVVGQPGDVYEQEADRVAEQVMRMPDPSTTEKMAVTEPYGMSHLQRKFSGCEEVFGGHPEEEETMQTKQIHGQTPEVTSDAKIYVQALRGVGQPLPKSVRAFFEPRFGHDFSKVRINTNDKAAMSAHSINARAYTVGHDIVFAAGQYNPGTKAGQQLLAHELAHTIQQAGAGRALSKQPAFLQRAVGEGSDPRSVAGEEETVSLGGRGFWRDLWCRFRFSLCFSGCTGDTWDPDRVMRCERGCREELDRCLRGEE